VGVFFALLLVAAVIGMRMRSVVLIAGVVVMPGGHALARRDRRHALQRETHRQHGYGEKAKQGSAHCLNSMSAEYGAVAGAGSPGRRMSAPL